MPEELDTVRSGFGFVPDAVGGHLQQVLEEGNAPAQQRGDVPRPVLEGLQVTVPGNGHEQVGGHQE